MQQPQDIDKATVEAARQWASGLEAVAIRIGARFQRSELRPRVTAYVRGRISPLERKNGWQMAEAAGDPAPYGVQHVLGRAVWSADAVHNALRAYVVEPLGDSEAVLVVDATGFVKKGVKGAGGPFSIVSCTSRGRGCRHGATCCGRGPGGDRRRHQATARTAPDGPRARQQCAMSVAHGRCRLRQ